MTSGCVVVNQDGKYLLVKEGGKWGFPKGKSEPIDNSICETAIREVYEETGIKCYPKKFLTVVVHPKGHQVLFWYATVENDKLKLQKEEIDQAEWLNLEVVEKLIVSWQKECVELIKRI